jgi:hypothetical protein
MRHQGHRACALSNTCGTCTPRTQRVLDVHLLLAGCSTLRAAPPRLAGAALQGRSTTPAAAAAAQLAAARSTRQPLQLPAAGGTCSSAAAPLVSKTEAPHVGRPPLAARGPAPHVVPVEQRRAVLVHAQHLPGALKRVRPPGRWLALVDGPRRRLGRHSLDHLARLQALELGLRGGRHGGGGGQGVGRRVGRKSGCGQAGLARQPDRCGAVGSCPQRGAGAGRGGRGGWRQSALASLPVAGLLRRAGRAAGRAAAPGRRTSVGTWTIRLGPGCHATMAICFVIICTSGCRPASLAERYSTSTTPSEPSSVCRVQSCGAARRSAAAAPRRLNEQHPLVPPPRPPAPPG